jgi:hypothetical protein
MFWCLYYTVMRFKSVSEVDVETHKKTDNIWIGIFETSSTGVLQKARILNFSGVWKTCE